MTEVDKFSSTGGFRQQKISQRETKEQMRAAQNAPQPAWHDIYKSSTAVDVTA
jgi:hypothetical protein